MKIKILDRKSLNLALFEAMVYLSDKQGRALLEVFGITADGDATEVEMQANVTVNGITVPFAEALEAAVNRMLQTFDEKFDKLVEDAAVKLVTELMQEVENAEWRIRDALRTLEAEP